MSTAPPEAAPTTPHGAAPTPPAERALAIDALRGWALLGIAIVNVPWIGLRESLPSLLFDEASRARLSIGDVASALFVEGLCEGRFYPIFSALFGLGTGLLLDRGLAPYGRRLLALSVFGVLHATFGWYGDVLLNYAAVGAVLLLLRRFGPRTLFGLAALFFVATELASYRFDDWFGPISDPEAHQRAVAEAFAVYHDGTFASITAYRFHELLGYFTLPWNVSYRFNVLCMATLGLALERAGLVRRLGELRPTLGRAALGLVAAGLALSALLPWVPLLYLPAGDVLALGWAATFLTLALGPGAARWARPFAAVGRMALTSYLLQTVCFTLFFYGYGLGMYGALGPLGGLLVSVAVYGAELVLAPLWLRRFEYGPMEWLWRVLTYLARPGLARPVARRG